MKCNRIIGLRAITTRPTRRNEEILYDVYWIPVAWTATFLKLRKFTLPISKTVVIVKDNYEFADLLQISILILKNFNLNRNLDGHHLFLFLLSSLIQLVFNFSTQFLVIFFLQHCLPSIIFFFLYQFSVFLNCFEDFLGFLSILYH